MGYTRLKLDDMDLALGKRVRLHRLLYEFGPGNGTILLLPVDLGLEHGPIDFFPNPQAQDSSFQLGLAREGGYSGIVFHIGLAQKYLPAFAGTVPLVLKINGRPNLVPDKYVFSPLDASVEDAVGLGADAVGYTLHVGSPQQGEDIAQLGKIRAACDRFGMPLIVWAHPRGEVIDMRGGRETLYAIDFAARVAQELGADVIKINVPDLSAERSRQSPQPYNELRLSAEEAVRQVLVSAGRTFVLFSGGAKMSDTQLLEKAELAMRAGATGLILGRNIWQRSRDQALALTAQIREIMQRPE